MKLNKTEQMIMNELKKSKHNHYCVSSYYGQGSQGGSVSGGQRELNAGLSLEKKGLIERTNLTRSALPDSGYTVHVCSIDYKLIA